MLKQYACLIALALLVASAACRRSGENVESSESVATSTTAVARGPSVGEWTTASGARDWAFPRDHAAHTDHWMEWWYYTGNLESKSGRKFGFQLTFFRTGVDRQPTSPSAWAVRDLYIAHFAISDVENRQIHSFEKSNRSGVGWAGADAELAKTEPNGSEGDSFDNSEANSNIRIWNAGWETTITDSHHHLKATAENASIDLNLTATKPLVKHHGDGLSQKGPTPGNASHYYSFTSLATEGVIRVDGAEFRVDGLSWMDHEFSSSFLEKGQIGWDWMAIQLDDDTQVMLYQIRRADGSASPFSSGTIVNADGSQQSLAADDIKMTPKKHWTSNATDGRYPISWEIRIAAADLKLTVKAAFEDQEMDTSASTGIIYWEGCIDVSGTRNNKDLSGSGYLEMTGYADQ